MSVELLEPIFEKHPVLRILAGTPLVPISIFDDEFPDADKSWEMSQKLAFSTRLRDEG